MLGVLERRERALERRAGRVRDARVVVALVLADGVLHERRRLVDRRRDRARGRVGLLAVVDASRLEVHLRGLMLSGAEPRGELVERLVEARRVAPRADELERLRLAVEARLRAADDLVADEEREHVVAVLALRLRHVHLEAVAEAPERLGAFAVVDQPVERREQRGAVGHGPSIASGCARHSPSTSSTPACGSALLAEPLPLSRTVTVSVSGYQRGPDPRAAGRRGARRRVTSP